MGKIKLSIVLQEAYPNFSKSFFHSGGSDTSLDPTNSLTIPIGITLHYNRDLITCMLHPYFLNERSSLYNNKKKKKQLDPLLL